MTSKFKHLTILIQQIDHPSIVQYHPAYKVFDMFRPNRLQTG